ncbi:glycoside hydrolase family 3 protein [Enterococcus cecorum]|uniref:glycoside hydrolase family 3 protein n=1 Tax=Enterococcus cecorum TaxID=44008 RepID=UPI000643C243|nr:glycoside hydrolase family 3 N-terminal domain-containing protein [Enterococcus cecorum]KLO69940.1 beta-hexosaminidase [Enterococcus cecorum]CAI3491244.1 beta-hexosaminidase [Enterococcus cecorum]
MLDLTQKPYDLNERQIEKLQTLLKNMDVEAKIGQLFFVVGQDEDMVDIAQFIQKYQPGGIMYRPDRAEKIKRELQVCQENSQIPMFTAANLEAGGNGIVREGSLVGYPMQIAATNDKKYAYELGRIAGYQANQVGVNMAFAPIVDIDLNFKNPITNVRTFGSDKQRVLDFAKEEIKGFAKNQVMAAIKHFPGDGVDERDQHLVSSVNSLSKEDWMASYGEIYQELINQGVPSVMIGHIMLPAWERHYNPELQDVEFLPASLSKYLINGLLRERLNFNGLALTDATPMLGYNYAMSRSEALPATINAGIDMILFNKNIDEDYEIIRQAVLSGVISAERLDEAVLRILATKLAQNVMDEDCHLQYNFSKDLNLKVEEFQPIVQEIADKSITLVKHQVAEVLPLTPEKYPRIRLHLLSNKQSGGFNDNVSALNQLPKYLTEAGFEVSVYNPSKLDFYEIFESGVQQMEEKFDLALYVANIENASNQTTTRLDWITLMAANAPWYLRDIPTVFASVANPYHLFDIPVVPTFINAYTANEVTVQALVDKLTGKSAFKGKSPVDPFVGQFDTRI